MTDPNEVRLVVGSQTFVGWQSMRLQRSIEQMAGAFVLQVTLKWAEEGEPFEIREGLPCLVTLGNDTVITGYIDEYELDFDADNSTVTIHGRDKTADLVDCAAIFKTGQWHNMGLKQIVNDIAKPFNVDVVVSEGAELGAVFKSFALEEGETAFCAIDRACRMRAVLCASTPQGQILLTRANKAASTVQLIEGVNIKSASARHSWKERYSLVTLKGQGKGDDSESGPTVAHAKAEAKDEGIDRYRPLVVVAEHGAGLKALKDRATWEVQVRMGRGKRGHIDVVGWRTGTNGQEGPLWTPNTMVYISSPRMKLDMDMLVVGCEYAIDDKKGRITKLTFCRPEAFDVVQGIKRSALDKKINHRTQKEKHQRRQGYNSSYDLDPPKQETR